MEIPPRPNCIFQKPIFQRAPFWDPAQTASEWGLLEYSNSTTAEILYSRSLYSRRLLDGFLYERLQNGVLWNIEIPPLQNSIFQKPISQRAPYWDPVQTASECGFLEYRNFTTAEILYSKHLYARMFLIGFLCKRLQNGVLWNIENSTAAEFYIPEAYIPKDSVLGSCTNCFRMGPSGIWKFHHTRIIISRSLYSKRLLIGILHKRLQNGVFWNIKIPPRQKFYIPEPYIPEGSLLGSSTNGSRMGCSGI